MNPFPFQIDVRLDSRQMEVLLQALRKAADEAPQDRYNPALELWLILDYRFREVGERVQEVSA